MKKPQKEDISEYLMVLDGISGMLQEIIKNVSDQNIKNFLAMWILYPLQQTLKDWVKTKKHKLIAYNGFSFSVK